MYEANQGPEIESQTNEVRQREGRKRAGRRQFATYVSINVKVV